jgi:hypothetical protein
MMKRIASINIPFIDVKANQKQGFGRTPNVFNHRPTPHTVYTALSNRSYPLIKMSVLSRKEVTPRSCLAQQPHFESIRKGGVVPP